LLLELIFAEKVNGAIYCVEGIGGRRRFKENISGVIKTYAQQKENMKFSKYLNGGRIIVAINNRIRVYELHKVRKINSDTESNAKDNCKSSVPSSSMISYVNSTQSSFYNSVFSSFALVSLAEKAVNVMCTSMKIYGDYIVIGDIARSISVLRFCCFGVKPNIKTIPIPSTHSSLISSFSGNQQFSSLSLANPSPYLPPHTPLISSGLSTRVTSSPIFSSSLVKEGNFKIDSKFDNSYRYSYILELIGFDIHYKFLFINENKKVWMCFLGG
jgi:hypothetical protein